MRDKKLEDGDIDLLCKIKHKVELMELELADEQMPNVLKNFARNSLLNAVNCLATYTMFKTTVWQANQIVELDCKKQATTIPKSTNMEVVYAMGAEGDLENLSELIARLEEAHDSWLGLTFVYLTASGLDYFYNDNGKGGGYTPSEQRSKAIESAIEGAKNSAPWVFRLDDGKVTEVTRVK